MVEHVELGVTGGPELSLTGGGVVVAVFRLLLLLLDGLLDSDGPLILNENRG